MRRHGILSNSHRHYDLSLERPDEQHESVFSQDRVDADKELGFNPSDDVSELFVPPSRRRGVLFGDFGLLLKADVVYEIIEQARITPIPGVMPVFKGIVNHRGNIVPVYDLNELVKNKTLQWERNRLIILNAGKQSVALFLYDLPVQVSPVVNVQENEVTHIPEVVRQNSSGIYRLDGVLWFDLKSDDLFHTLRDSSLFSSEEGEPKAYQEQVL